MSLDFALKDFYRKKEQNYPYVLIIALVLAFSEFLILFITNTGLDMTLQTTGNSLFFSGSIQSIYSGFYRIILILVIIMAITVVSIIGTTFILNKKRDIAIMRAIGTLPGNLHGFYLLEVVIIYFLGFVLGFIIGIISFGIYAGFSLIVGILIQFQLELLITFITFIACLGGVIVVPGLILVSLGKKNLIKSFSKEISYDYNASRGLRLIPKWISKISFNMKMAVVNTLRRKGEYQRYVIVFSILFVITFTIGLGTFVLGNSAREWINKSQGDDIVIVAHEDVVHYYGQMYQMFSNPSLFIDKEDINFTSPQYLFNLTKVEAFNNITEIRIIDERLIQFLNVIEESKVIVNSYDLIGQNRAGNYPFIGVNASKMIQEFEMEGNFFSDLDNVVVGDGLAFNFFDDVLQEGINFTDLSFAPDISGFAIDSFYNGYAGYMSLEKIQSLLGLTSEINFILLKIEADSYDNIKNNLKQIIEANLGGNFRVQLLDGIFNDNLNYLFSISLYPLFLVVILVIVGIVSLYNYQKGGIIEKSKDIYIMKAIGSKSRNIKKTLIFEGFFIIIPSLLISLSFGMIINSLFLIENVVLPPLYIPLILISIIAVFAILINILSLRPLLKKMNIFSIKNFNVY